jgi:hypothetical protein
MLGSQPSVGFEGEAVLGHVVRSPNPVQLLMDH